jgi:polar amino acid transport system substrate-binding protein
VHIAQKCAAVIADQLKVKLTLVSVTGQNRIPYLADKRVDIAFR